jgi:hypothetical protein
MVAVLSWNAGIRAIGAIDDVLIINLVPVIAILVAVALSHDFGRARYWPRCW